MRPRTSNSSGGVTSKASDFIRVDEEYGLFPDIAFEFSIFTGKPLSVELEDSFEVEDPEEDYPPRGRKRTRSDCRIEWASPLEETINEPTVSSPENILPVECEVEEPSITVHTLESFANKPAISNQMTKHSALTPHDENPDALGKGSESDTQMPRTPSEENFREISNEMFLFTHEPSATSSENASQKPSNDTPDVSDTDIASIGIARDDDDFPLPEIQYNHNSEYFERFEEETAARAHTFAADKASLESLWSRSEFRILPTLGDQVLDEFLRRSIAKTQALHAEGTWASRTKAKEIERIVECVLVDEKDIDAPEWVLGKI
ncbi:hypothetical protein P7C71_g6130, partial [Lecanoromycetidae sp. Uapishka_2]